MTEDPIRSLYESQSYPALSYPSCDPAVMWVAARMAGLECASPASARILEVGCSSGHHLLHLAARWPNARFTGIDLSTTAIRDARAAADAAGLQNVEFIDVPLEGFDAGDEPFEFLVAHGFYSWVPPEVKDSLMVRLPSLIGENGIAAIGYNTLPGWALRRPVGEVLRRWMSLPGGSELPPTEMLEQLEKACPADTYGAHMRAMLHHMRTQGASTLPFDDLPECNYPCTFSDFVDQADRSGLQYLGEADFGQNLPANLSDEALSSLSPLASDPNGYQQAIDVFSGRSHRVSLLCSKKARIDPAGTALAPLDFAVRTEHQVQRTTTGVSLRHSSRPGANLSHPLASNLFEILGESAPGCVSMSEVLDRLGKDEDISKNLPALAGLITDAMRRGLVLARSEAVQFSSEVPDRPSLSPLRLHSVRHNRSLVDIYHTPLVFQEKEYGLLAKMDGTRTSAELEELSAPLRSGVQFHQWLALLARHGVFV